MSKILVTGSEGSLMQAVIPYLLDQGHEVIGVDNLFRYNERLNIAKGYLFENLDLTNAYDVHSLIGKYKPDYIIQAAARIFGVGGFNKYCADILYNDVTLHGNILESAYNWKVKRVVYISSSMVYENCPQDVFRPVYEDQVDVFPAPHTEYGMSKFIGERLSRAYKKQYDLDYTIWRPFNIITPYEKSEGDVGISHVCADYIKNIVIEKKQVLPIIGDGKQIRCFTWIDDVARAIAQHSFSETTKNEIFNLGNKEPISMSELALTIRDIAVEKGMIEDNALVFDSIAEYENDVRVRVPDVTKVKQMLGWEAKIKVDESIDRCLEKIKVHV
jgi:nucleoside-diphosphate-sugar epimerase